MQNIMIPEGIPGNEKQPLISVLMPAYNASRTINRAVRSTLLALPSNAELLVYLDGCTDDTNSVLRQIRDQRLHIFESKENSGIAQARNFLLAQASGTYIAHMDSDDICLPWRFREQLKVVGRERVDLLFTNALILKKSRGVAVVVAQPPVSLSDKDCKIFLTLGNPFVNSSLLAKREIFIRLGGFNSVASEDLDLWLRAAALGLRFRRISQHCVVYRLSPSQVTGQVSWLADMSAQQPEIAAAQNRLAFALGIDTKSSSERREIIGSENYGYKFWNLRLAKLVSFFDPKRSK